MKSALSWPEAETEHSIRRPTTIRTLNAPGLSFQIAAFAVLAASTLLASRVAQAGVTGEWVLNADGAPGIPVNFTTSPMMSIQQGFCFFTHVQGRFLGLGEAGHVYVGSDGNWYMSVATQQSGMSFHARCVTWDSFANSAGHTYTVTPRWDYSNEWGGIVYDSAVWSTASLCYANLLSGNFDHGQTAGTIASYGDDFWHNVGISDNPAGEGSGNYIESGTFCAWLGRPTRAPTTDGLPTAYGFTHKGVLYQPMINSKDGACWITGITGAFAGAGEQAYIDLDATGTWILHVITQQGDTGATASCAYFN